MSTLYYETSNSLTHHGVKGQKWGVRRYQNEDGSLTAKGKMRYYKSDIRKEYDEAQSAFNSIKADYKTRFKDPYKYHSNLSEAKNRVTQASLKRLESIDRNKKAVREHSSKLENILYGNSARRYAAKLITDHDLTIDEAKRISKRRTNVARVLVASVIATNALASVVKNNKNSDELYRIDGITYVMR